MSRKNNKRYTKAQAKERIEAKKKAKRLAMQKHITIFTLLALLIIGLVSTTFASFTTPAQTGNSGSLVAQIKTNAVNNGNKDHIAPVGADVDNAETSAQKNLNWQGKVFFLVPEKWDISTYSHIQVDITRTTSATSSNYQYYAGKMTRVGDTRLYYLSLSADHSNWNQDEYIAFTANDHEYGSGTFNLNGNHYYTTPIDYGCNNSGNFYVFKPNSSSNFTSTTNGNAMSGNWGSNNTIAVATQTAQIYTDGSSSASGGKVSYSGLNFSNNTSTTETTTKTGESSSTNVALSNAVLGSSMSFTATPNTGYKFDGWYSAATGGTKLSSNATYSYNVYAAKTVYARFVADGYSYTVTAGVGGNITSTPTSGTASSVTVTAEPNTGYEFAGWETTNGDVTDSSSASTTFTPSANGANAKAAFRLIPPISLGFTPSGHISGGGTTTNPYVVHTQSVFKLTAQATLSNNVQGIVPHYSDSSTGNYSGNNVFTPICSTTGAQKPYTVYAKAYASNNSVYSDAISKTIYYSVYSYLNGANITFDIDKSQITSVESIQLSNASITGISDIDEGNITFTYQVKTGDSEYEDIDGSVWSPSSTGEYTFRVKAVHKKTNQTVYSTLVKNVTVKTSEVNYTVVNDGSISQGVEVIVNGDSATNGTLAGNSQVKISITRPSSDYYIQYLKVNGASVNAFENYNGNISNYIVVDQAKTDITINYKILEKPKVTIAKPDGSESINFKYFVDGTESTVTAAGIYIVDYNKVITYSVTPSAGYYVQSMTGVTMGSATSGTATGTAKVISSINNVTATFAKNPKIYMIQPQYGSVYVTSGSGNNLKYYFNGDSVDYGTELTVNVKKDHANAILNDVIVNVNNTDNSIGETDGSKFRIYDDTTASADITIKSGHEFIDSTEYGMRRIFFTDNLSWGDNNVSVHYSNTNGDTDFSKNSVVMTYKFLNDASQRVYYADIPYSSKYVTFYNKSNTSQKTSQATITNEGNAFWNDNGTCKSWQENYSDYIATDRVTSIQQGTATKGSAATFTYVCEFGDETLSAVVEDGDDAAFSFNNGTFSIMPTENTEGFSLVKVTSASSTTVKYYLIRVPNFEISSFGVIQKVFDSGLNNTLKFLLSVKGGALEYSANYFKSSTNISNSYSEINGEKSSFDSDGLGAYIQNFTISYTKKEIEGIQYFKVITEDAGGHLATATVKTLFGVHTYGGERIIYFKNASGKDISKYNVRACFEYSNNNTFVTMQQVSNTNYYRAVIPKSADVNTDTNKTCKVNFYLCNPDTFSNNVDDYDGTNDSKEIYSYSVRDEDVPNIDSEQIVYSFNGLDGSTITGSFVDFN